MEWISVNERLPEEVPVEHIGLYASDRVLVVITDDYDKSIAIAQTINGKWDIEKMDVTVTHWLPLPDPPAD